MSEAQLNLQFVYPDILNISKIPLHRKAMYHPRHFEESSIEEGVEGDLLFRGKLQQLGKRSRGRGRGGGKGGGGGKERGIRKLT